MKKTLAILLIIAAVAAGCKSKVNPSAPGPDNTATDTATITPTWTITQTATASPTFTVTPTNTPMSITLQYGVNSYASTKDNSIWQISPNTNCGGQVNGFVGNVDGTGIGRRMLIYFDLSGVTWNPANTMIKADILYTLNNIEPPSGSFGVTPYLLSQDWVEGDCLANCQSYSSWNNYDSGLTWANPGGDYGAAAGPSSFMDGSVPAYVKRVIEINTSVINSWITLPSANHGVVLISDVESTAGYYMVVDTKEDPTTSNRPKLEIFYY